MGPYGLGGFNAGPSNYGVPYTGPSTSNYAQQPQYAPQPEPLSMAQYIQNLFTNQAALHAQGSYDVNTLTMFDALLQQHVTQLHSNDVTILAGQLAGLFQQYNNHMFQQQQDVTRQLPFPRIRAELDQKIKYKNAWYTAHPGEVRKAPFPLHSLLGTLLWAVDDCGTNGLTQELFNKVYNACDALNNGIQNTNILFPQTKIALSNALQAGWQLYQNNNTNGLYSAISTISTVLTKRASELLEQPYDISNKDAKEANGKILQAQIKTLLGLGASPDLWVKHGDFAPLTGLCHADRCGMRWLEQALLEYGADPNYKNPLERQVRDNNRLNIRLITAGANTENVWGIICDKLAHILINNKPLHNNCLELYDTAKEHLTRPTNTHTRARLKCIESNSVFQSAYQEWLNPKKLAHNVAASVLSGA